jgi:hypothetical protein
MTLSIMTLSIMTLSIMTLSIMTLNTMTLRITIKTVEPCIENATTSVKIWPVSFF